MGMSQGCPPLHFHTVVSTNETWHCPIILVKYDKKCINLGVNSSLRVGNVSMMQVKSGGRFWHSLA